MADLSPGVACAISPLVRRIVAPNAGPLTGAGSNTYLVGVDEIVVVDPGPDVASHVEAIVGCGGDRIRWIAVTHSHDDHAGGAAALAAATGAEVLAYGTIDEGFELEATEFRLEALHTPGHAADHLCYLLEEERMLFSGDTVIDGSTVMIAPPEGDMAAYLASLERLLALPATLLLPGHGPPIGGPRHRLRYYLEHRRRREERVRAALEAGPRTLEEVVVDAYDDTPAESHGLAARSALAHLLKLEAEGRVVRAGEDRWARPGA
jgi:glyoxylase-like metal-dependent hydrolase (beta-lactamase superfamily II)